MAQRAGWTGERPVFPLRLIEFDNSGVLRKGATMVLGDKVTPPQMVVSVVTAAWARLGSGLQADGRAVEVWRGRTKVQVADTDWGSR